jgi:hypothetical protein
VSVGGLLALGYGSKKITRKKRRNADFAKEIVTVTRSKCAKEKERWREVRERKMLDEEIEDDR